MRTTLSIAVALCLLLVAGAPVIASPFQNPAPAAEKAAQQR